jgi:hypothetical protein
MIADLKDGGYTWQMESAKKGNGKSAGYYILGYPG